MPPSRQNLSAGTAACATRLSRRRLATAIITNQGKKKIKTKERGIKVDNAAYIGRDIHKWTKSVKISQEILYLNVF